MRAFVNTLDVEDSLDALADSEEAQKWLAAHGLDGGENSVAEDDRERLVAVREALRHCSTRTTPVRGCRPTRSRC